MAGAGVLMFIAVLSFHELAVASGDSQSAPRTAALLHGDLILSRQLAAEHRLPQSGRLIAQHNVHLWVLGLPAHQQQAVHATLTDGSADAKLLHALPGQNHAWLIHADQEAIQSVLDKHKDCSAAPLPSGHKLSSTVSRLIEAVQQGRADSQLPEDLAHIQHEMLTGDQVKMHLVAVTAGVPVMVLKALASQVQQRLQQLPITNRQLLAVTATASWLHVSLDVQDIELVSMWLADQPEVTWLEAKASAKLHDLHSIANMQDPRDIPNSSYPAPDVSQANMYHPYWKAGLDGTGQVVGVLDSGLDLDSCYVWDPAQADYKNGPNTRFLPISNDPQTLGNVSMYTNKSARKVVAYVFYADNTDDIEGHGTHVSTSMVGAMYGTDPVAQPDNAVGVAPNAKVAMFDVGTATTFDITSLDSVDSVMDLLRTTGAAVTCNSWGFVNVYDYTNLLCSAIDDYVWRKPDMLHVAAAGNDGYAQPLNYRNGTVSPPGTCKNVLTVAAAENYVYGGAGDNVPVINMVDAAGQQVKLPASGFLGPRQYGSIFFGDSSGNGRVWNSEYYSFMPVDGVDPRLTLLQNKTVQVLNAQPLDACTPLDPAFLDAIPAGKSIGVMILTNKQCLTQALANAFVDPRIVAAFFYSNPSKTLLVSAQDLPYTGRSSATLISRNLTAYVQDGLSNNQAMFVSWFPPNGTSPKPTENIAEFSSFGSPLAFGINPTSSWARIKPEIAAAGFISAAHSDGQFTGQKDQCATVVKKGTSMATPQVAGAALLARQYFTDGFYPTGAKVAGNGFIPSAALVKATLIVGTIPMAGVRAVDVNPLGTPPDPFQGFGRLALSNSLPLATDPRNLKMQVVDNVMLTMGGTYQMNLTIDSQYAGGPLVVVMTFMDAAAFPGARSSAVNDLDLLVTAPAAAAAVGSGNGIFYPNHRTNPDPTNNVEKVFIAQTVAGTYRATVTASYVYQATMNQTFSMVAIWSPNAIGGPAPSPPGTAATLTSPSAILHMALGLASFLAVMLYRG